MSQIVGLEGLSDAEINRELQNGARFVIYRYCISIVVLSFMRPSAIHFVRCNESRFAKGVPYTMLSLVLGWWGIPFGLIYTVWSVASNCSGGVDVTDEILNSLAGPPPQD